jgi:hypothetical protein
MLTWREIDEAPEGAPAFELLAKQPRLRVKTKGPGAFVGNVRYCIIPIRALWLLKRVDPVIARVNDANRGSNKHEATEQAGG